MSFEVINTVFGSSLNAEDAASLQHESDEKVSCVVFESKLEFGLLELKSECFSTVDQVWKIARLNFFR